MGAAGSSGNTFVPMAMARYTLRKIVIFSRNEMKQWKIAKKYQGDPRGRFLIGDVRGTGINLHYIPVHLQPYYQQLGSRPGDCPEGERCYAQAISLPMFYTLGEGRQDAVVQALTEVLSS